MGQSITSSRPAISTQSTPPNFPNLATIYPYHHDTASFLRDRGLPPDNMLSPPNTNPRVSTARCFHPVAIPFRPAGSGSSQPSTPSKTTRTPKSTPNKLTTPSSKLSTPSKQPLGTPLSAQRASPPRRTPLKTLQKRNTNLPLPTELRDRKLFRTQTLLHLVLEAKFPQLERY